MTEVRTLIRDLLPGDRMVEPGATVQRTMNYAAPGALPTTYVWVLERARPGASPSTART
jgi:hypothetical protein